LGGEIILYTSEDKGIAIQLRAEDGTVWLSQMQMAELFEASKQSINYHIKSILAEQELIQSSTVKEILTVQTEGQRTIRRKVKYYNLEMILSVGYRVKSQRGTQFRQWATTSLREYLVKGFVIDSDRLKNPGRWDYFDELLEKIRDIRASEKRFYQKVCDIYATSVDYDSKSDQAQLFFKKVQNKMLWAITGHTAAEIVSRRANPRVPNMGLTSWRGSRVRKQDVTIAKNYLNQGEIDELNRVVTMYLDYAEDQARRRKQVTMREWEHKLDAFLSFNERDVLNHAGKVKAAVAETLALERYELFDAGRRESERLAADQKDMEALEQIEKRALTKSKKEDR
jgi:hypothetical protein